MRHGTPPDEKLIFEWVKNTGKAPMYARGGDSKRKRGEIPDRQDIRR